MHKDAEKDDQCPEGDANSARASDTAKVKVSPYGETASLNGAAHLGLPPSDQREQRELIDAGPTTSTTPGTGVPASTATFSANEFVANRYRIIRFIGQGGMGEVYEAEDEDLHERVALKTIRSDIASEERAIGRFKREIQLARNVTHPNVCRIFDLGYHRRPRPKGDITFFTMELLAGETLAERLRRTGRLSTTEALPIVAQMAYALSAAHKAGIIHRDFKSGNVILVPSPEGSRAVVTDFGLADRTAQNRGSGGSASTTSDIVGTPTYMAPEQVRGGKITPATDVYSLGVVMYEMVTGKTPFVGDTPLSVAVMRLEADPLSPRKHVANLDSKWEAAILRCLKRNPAQRFSSAADVVDAISGETPASRKQRFRRLVEIGLLASLILLAALTYFFTVQRKPQGAGNFGYVRLTATPWAEVTAIQKSDGRRLSVTGQTPMQLRLPPGSYQIELRKNSVVGKESVTVKAGEIHSVNHSFPEVKTDDLVEKALAEE